MAALLTLACLICSTAATADEPDYSSPDPLPRIALLVGVQSYAHLDPLANISLDVDLVYGALDTLGFSDILVVSNPCLSDLHNAVDALAQRIRELAPDGGATVIVFFAGHGAMNANEQYVLPAEFDETLIGAFDYHQISLPASYLEEKLKAVMTGAGIVMIDACRTNFPPPAEGADAVEPADEPVQCSGGTSVWRKQSAAPVASQIGFRPPQQKPHVALAFSTRPGGEAVSLDERDEPSPYVAAIVKELNGAEPIVPDLFSRAYEDVLDSTAANRYPLQPDFRLNGLTRSRLNDDRDDSAAQTLRWQKTLEIATQSRSAVENYIRAFPSGIFLRPALRWLRDHPATPTSPVLVPIETGQSEVDQYSAVLPRGTELRQFPVEGVAMTRRARLITDRAVVLQGERTGEWLQVMDVAANQPRFVLASAVVADQSELPAYWSDDSATDVTQCVAAAADSATCLEANRSSVVPTTADAIVDVLSVEDPDTDASVGAPSAAAFDEAIAIQLALNQMGVPLSQTRIKVVPRSFAPALSGRVLVKLSTEN